MVGNIETVRGDIEEARKRKRRSGFIKERGAGALDASIFGHLRLTVDWGCLSDTW